MRTCSIDGCPRKHQARGYCSKHYNEIVMGPDRHKVTITCLWCGKPHITTRSKSKYCSLECRDAHKRAMSEPKTEPYKSSLMVWVLTCYGCGRQFNAGTKESRYCGKRCRGHAASRRQRVARGGMSTAEWASLPRPCEWCGDTFHSPIPAKKYCCSQCSRQASRSRGVLRGGGKWIDPHRRRRLYERDKYICYICGESTDNYESRKVGNRSPSLDHVIPRVNGGKDDDSNLRCAHRICNSIKAEFDLATARELLVQHGVVLAT